ncbi:hypothetical protein SUGI_0761240 [Cryptomeria japonica]|nr:hypothetical protein SUGI_0761240 [Cryptomeria japonica]
MKRPSKTQLYELHTIYEENEEENIEDTAVLSGNSEVRRHKSQLERFSRFERFSYMAILMGIMLSLLLLMGRPLAKASMLILN